MTKGNLILSDGEAIFVPAENGRWTIDETLALYSTKPIIKPAAKEYEILSYVTPFMGEEDVVFNKQEKGVFWGKSQGRYWTNSEKTLLDDGAKIHSVRRTSDGEVFTIGEQVEHNTYGYREKIYGFTIPRTNAYLMWFCTNNDIDAAIDDRLVKDLKNFKKLAAEPEKNTEYPDEFKQWWEKQQRSRKVDSCPFDIEQIEKRIAELWHENGFVPFQLCPKCNGSGKKDLSKCANIINNLSEEAYLKFFERGHDNCDVCNGAKIIPMHKTDK